MSDVIRPTAISLIACFSLVGCAVDGSAPEPDDELSIGSDEQGLSDPAARRVRSAQIRDAAAAKGMTNGVLLAGIAQVETGLSHCWSEATWACQGPNSPSCGGGPVIAGAADGPCSAQQGGLGMFQFDGGTFAQTLARDGEAILLIEGNVDHAVDFVVQRVREEVAGVSSVADAIAWLNSIPVQAGDPLFEEWIAIVSCRYNGCCGCSTQEGKYRSATLDAWNEFEPGFWGDLVEPPVCEPIPVEGAVIDEDDACAEAGGNPQYWRVVTAGYNNRMLWTHATDSSTAENYGQWNLDFAEAGRYRLEVHMDDGTYSESTRAAYHIRAGGEELVVVVDQTVGNGFQLVADIDFAAGGDQWVRLDDNTGEPLSTETRIAFDALRITAITDQGDPRFPNPLDPGTNDGTGDDPGEGSGDSNLSGGCQTGTGGESGAGFVLLLLGAVLLLRRRSS